jgi:Family of unknown function (DUF5947)
MEVPTDRSKNDGGSESLTALRRFARSRRETESCELCGSEVGREHPHLLDRASRRITCSCQACAILFCGRDGARLLRVPKRVVKLESFRFSDLEWDALTLPIHMVFFLRGPNGETTALYPSPAGVMESMIKLPSWREFIGGNAALKSVEPEVEALLVNRIGDRGDYFIVPIDTAYRLVGLIRTKWRGLSGGAEVWQAITELFASLEREATSVREVADA